MWNPTLLSSCARAATAEEARFRIDGPEPTPRSTRVVALDAQAATLVDRGAGARRWRGAHFLYFRSAGLAGGSELTVDAIVRGQQEVDAVLVTAEGQQTRLGAELDDADAVVMVATADDGAEGALMIGAECARRGIMTAGLVLPDGDAVTVDRTVSMLRPYAMVLLVSKDPDDLVEILTALRA